MTVPEILKEARKQHGYSMRQVGEFIGRSHQVVYFAEKNVKGIAIDGILLRDLCNVYALEFETIMEQLKMEKAV